MARGITLKGFKEYEKRLKEAPAKLSALTDLEASAAAQNIANAARKRVQSGGIDVGGLWSKINASGEHGHYDVTVAANYAAYYEFGTLSKVEVPEDLKDYAIQFKAPGNVNREPPRGIPARPYLFPSVDEEQPKFFARLQNVLDNL